MELNTRGLGFRLIAVSAVIVAVAAAGVAIVVTRLSEDEVKTRLLSQAGETAALVGEVAEGGDPQDLARALLSSKLRKAGSAWVLDREGRYVANPDPRHRKSLEEGAIFGDTEVELTAVSQPLAQIGEKGVGHKVALRSVVGRYDSGMGFMIVLGEPHVVAFKVLPERGWIVGVDEPATATYSSTASLKKYILLTCAILGLSILLSTAISIAYIIQPFYREKLELSEKIEAANRNLKKLHEVSVGMQKSLALDDRFRKVLGAAHEVLGLERILLFLPNAQNTVLECRGGIGNHDEPAEALSLPISREGGAVAQAYLTRKTFRVVNARDLPKDLRLAAPYSEMKALRSRSFVVMPMIVGNQSVGVVAVDNQLSKAPITDEILEGLELFTSQAAVAIENAKLYQQLKVYAGELEVTDHLTQLFTFFHFKKLLQGEIDRARVSGRSLHLAVVSVDDFAGYNERMGHKNGDEVLRRVAQAIRGGARKKDLIGRCFGSTFGVILPDAGDEGAHLVVGEMLQGLQGQAYPGEEGVTGGRIRFLSAVGTYVRGAGSTAEDFFGAVLEESKKSV